MFGETARINAKAMNKPAEKIALFDAFLQGELSPTERSEFELKLANDSNFKQAFDEFRQLENIIRNAEYHAIKNQLNEWEKETGKSQHSSVKIRRLSFIITAAAVAVLGFLSFHFFWNQPDDAALVAAHFEPYENVLTVRGETVTLEEGLNLYDQSSYESAIEIFKAFPEDRMAKFYLAESHMALKNFEAAIPIYEELATKSDVLDEVIPFHLALAYLGAGNKQACQEQLKTIPANSFYATAARDLLNDL